MRRVVLTQLVAVLVVALGLAPWAEGVSGFDLAASVRQAGGDLDGLPPAWFGWAWLVLPTLALAAWLALYVPRQPPEHLGLLLGLAISIFTIAFVIAASAADADVGWAAYATFFLGATAIVVDRLAASGARPGTTGTF